MIASLFYAQPVPKALSVISVISVWPLKFPFFFYFCGTKKTLFLLAVCGFFCIFALTIWDVSAIAGCGSAMSGQADAAFALHRNCQCRRTMIVYVSKSKNLWSYWAGGMLLSAAAADVSLAEAEKPLVGKSRLGATVAAEAEVVPPRRGRQDLWIPRPPLTLLQPLDYSPSSFLLPRKISKHFTTHSGSQNCPFFVLFARVRFPAYKPRLSTL